MPAKSKKQQMAAGAALSAKRGERSKASLKGASRGMADSMNETQLEEMASVKRKRLPARAASSAKTSSAKSGDGRRSSGGESKSAKSSGAKSGGSKRSGTRSGSR